MVWAKIAGIIIRRRFFLLGGLLLVTLFMGYHAQHAKISHQFLQIMPESDPIFQGHVEFKEHFGEDGNLFVIGFKGPLTEDLPMYTDWFRLSQRADTTRGVQEVLSLGGLYDLSRNDELERLEVIPFPDRAPDNVNELDSYRTRIANMPFYEGMLYDTSMSVHIMAIRFDKPTLYSAERVDIIEELKSDADHFGLRHDVRMRYSGLPYIRSVMVTQIASEIELFIGLAILITALILLIFFRSLYSMVFPLIVIGILIVFVLGTFGLFNYRITLLSALIPPLIVVICVPNFIYFLNKYHIEFRKHGNKMRAISRVIQKIGVITFMTNFSTAIGFGVLAMTKSPALQEFGLVASLNIIATYVVTLIVIPVVFTLLPEPSGRQTGYLQNRSLNRVLGWIETLVFRHRKSVYLASGGILILAVIGLTRLEAVGYIMDDMPRDEAAYQDLLFFEDYMNGVMPFEVSVDTRKEKGLRSLDNLTKMNAFQDSMDARPELSRSMSSVNLLKFARQAYFGGDRQRYGMPSQREQTFLQPYLTNMEEAIGEGRSSIMDNLVDEDQRRGRITAQIKDIGSVRLQSLLEELKWTAGNIFPAEDFDVSFTGSSIIFVKGNDYLVRNLLQSLALAFFLIALIIGLLFRRVRMIFLSLVPNFLPLIVTAGIMGFAGIPLKPSTILVFSIAFGISIDDALHFLGKYRQELRHHSWNVSETVRFALKETGTSMIYTSLVLFSGFAIFYFSNFGGTQAIGLLTSLTLLVAMVTNLVLLPSLLMSFAAGNRNRK